MTPPIFLALIFTALVLVAQAYRGEWGAAVIVVLSCIVAALVFIPLKDQGD